MEIMHVNEWRKLQVAKKTSSKVGKLTANQLTNQVLQYLNSSGFVVWRNNVMGVFDVKIVIAKVKKMGMPKGIGALVNLLKGCYRKSHERKGVSDIVGYQKKTGRMIAIEVKIGKDELSVEQTFFIQEVNRHGGIAFVAKTWRGFLEELERHIK